MSPLPAATPAQIVEKLHRIDPEVVKADFQRAGFELEGCSDFCATPPTTTPAGLRPEDPRQDRPRSSTASGSRVDARTREEAAARADRGGGAYLVLLALLVGLLAGAVRAALGDGLREPALQVAELDRRRCGSTR